MTQTDSKSAERFSGIGMRPWGIVAASIGGLLLAISVAGIIALVENERSRDVTQRALSYDLEVEDEGDDLRVAVLDMRHYHRNLLFDGTSGAALADFEEAYAELMEEIGELEQVGITDPSVPTSAHIRELAESYYADFSPAIALYSEDPAAFQQASDEGLRRIEELDRAADDIDDLGEDLTQASFTRIAQAADSEQLILIALLCGVAVVGVAMAISAGRVLTRLAASYSREQATARELARALRTKTDFIGDASHELRTPLAVIQGNAEIGLAASEDQVRRDVLAEIWSESSQMSRLVDDLLFLARSDAGAPPLEHELVPARWLLSRMAKPAEVLAQKRSSCLTFALAAEGYLEVDPERVEQAVLILVDNAAKHAPEGTCVTLASRVQGTDLLVEVADAGPGIPAEELPLIFDRFYQVGNRRARKKDGSGLGLSIAKTIVEAHGGTLGVASRVNAGTQMTIRLPLCATPEPALGPGSEPALDRAVLPN